MKKIYIYIIGGGLLIFLVLLFSGFLPFGLKKGENPVQLVLNVKNSGLGSAVYIEWNSITPKPSSYALARANVGSDVSSFNVIPTVSNTGGNFAIDYDVQRGATYEYKVIPIYGNSFNLDGIDKVSGVRITTDFIETKSEKVLFVIPQKYLETRKDLTQIIPSLVDEVNVIYSNTKKQFSFAGLKTYNPDTCVNGCENIIADSEYYSPGALVVYVIPGAMSTGYTQPGAQPIVVLGNELFPKTEPDLDFSSNSSLHSSLVQILAHEIAHTYGVAFPEYYVYPNAIDNSGVSPQIPAVSLSTKYLKDIMFTYQGNFRNTFFGPLSVYIINANLYHSDMRFRSRSLSDMSQIYPSRIEIKVSDSISKPITSSKVDIYCIQGEDPRYQGLHQQPTLVKSLSTDTSGTVSFVLENEVKQSMSAQKCHVLGLKVSKDSFISSSNYITELQLQEEKLLRKSDNFSIQFTLKSN
mgnify:FL=1